jgi:hypothetical protein
MDTPQLDQKEERPTPIGPESTYAENVRAWKELMSSAEARQFVETFFEKASALFGQTGKSIGAKTISSMSLMVTAFFCVGFFSWQGWVNEGTTGVLSGIIIGYFFKKQD